MSDTRILQLTDLHLFCDETSTLKGIPTRQTLQDVVAFILQQEAPFDRVVVTGDHTHDERPESYAVARELLSPWVEQLAIVPGNHDDRDVMRSVLGDVIDRQSISAVEGDDRITFSFRCGHWLCVGMDTHLPGAVPGQFGEAQAAWLRSLLQEYTEHPTLLFCHHPPVDVGSIWMDAIGLQDRHLLLEVVHEFPQVQLISCGHVHHDSEHHAGSTRVVTSPSTGLQFDPDGSQPRFAADPPGYRIIELTDDRLTTHVGRLPQASHTPDDQ